MSTRQNLKTNKNDKTSKKTRLARRYWCASPTAQFLLKFSLTAVHTGIFPCWKAGMTGFWTRLLVKANFFLRTHEQTKLVKKFVKENVPIYTGLLMLHKNWWFVRLRSWLLKPITLADLFMYWSLNTEPKRSKARFSRWTFHENF